MKRFQDSEGRVIKTGTRYRDIKKNHSDCIIKIREGNQAIHYGGCYIYLNKDNVKELIRIK